MFNLEDGFCFGEVKTFEVIDESLDEAPGIKSGLLQRREKHSAERYMIEQYIKNNYTKVNFALSEMAEAFGYEYSYFSKYFLKLTGKTFKRYLNDIGLEAARELIQSTDFKDFKCYEISKMVGYSSYEHFARLYKEKFGKWPNKMRKGAALGEKILKIT